MKDKSELHQKPFFTYKIDKDQKFDANMYLRV